MDGSTITEDAIWVIADGQLWGSSCGAVVLQVLQAIHPEYNAPLCTGNNEHDNEVTQSLNLFFSLH